MRRLMLAGLAGVTVFAITSAAASSIDVSGPFNPRAGAGEVRVCDLGAITVTPTLTLIEGVEVASELVLATTKANDAEGNTCADVNLWLKVDTILPATSYYMRISADSDYRLVGGQPAVFDFADEAANPVYTDLELTEQVTTPPPVAHLLVGEHVHWLITMNTPTDF